MCWGTSADIYESVLGKIGKREGIVREVSRTMPFDPETPWVHLNRFLLKLILLIPLGLVYMVCRFSDQEMVVFIKREFSC